MLPAYFFYKYPILQSATQDGDSLDRDELECEREMLMQAIEADQKELVDLLLQRELLEE